MQLDFLNELENKVDALLKNLDTIREENKRLSEELNAKKEQITQLTTQQQQLQAEIDSLRATNATHDSKLKVVAEKIQGLLAKIETV